MCATCTIGAILTLRRIHVSKGYAYRILSSKNRGGITLGTSRGQVWAAIVLWRKRSESSWGVCRKSHHRVETFPHRDRIASCFINYGAARLLLDLGSPPDPLHAAPDLEGAYLLRCYDKPVHAVGDALANQHPVLSEHIRAFLY